MSNVTVPLISICKIRIKLCLLGCRIFHRPCTWAFIPRGRGLLNILRSRMHN